MYVGADVPISFAPVPRGAGAKHRPTRLCGESADGPVPPIGFAAEVVASGADASAAEAVRISVAEKRSLPLSACSMAAFSFFARMAIGQDVKTL